MERRKRRPTYHNPDDEHCNCPNCNREEEEPRVEFLEEELLPVNLEIKLKPQPSLSLAVPNMYFVRDLLKKCWCKETAYQKSLKSGHQCPSRGQCYVTALLIQQIYGGEIMTGTIRGEEHYWNMINDVQIDFTSDQYGGDGYHPIILNGTITKGNTNNKRFQLLDKRWNKLILEECGWRF